MLRLTCKNACSTKYKLKYNQRIKSKIEQSSSNSRYYWTLVKYVQIQSCSFYAKPPLINRQTVVESFDKKIFRPLRSTGDFIKFYKILVNSKPCL